MTHSLGTIIALLLVLQIKHFICDYPLQTHYHLVNKGTYGHPGGIIHAMIHAGGTAFAFLVVTPSLVLGVAILLAEVVIHYHLDWGKGQVMKATGWTADSAPFWWAIGADQLFHHLTYVGIVAVLLIYGT